MKTTDRPERSHRLDTAVCAVVGFVILGGQHHVPGGVYLVFMAVLVLAWRSAGRRDRAARHG